MAVLKLNEEKMSKNNKRKPSSKEIVNVINSLIQDIHSIKNDMNTIFGTFDWYIEYKGDKMLFKDFIDKKVNEQQEGKDELQATGQDNTVANPADSPNQG